MPSAHEQLKWPLGFAKSAHDFRDVSPRFRRLAEWSSASKLEPHGEIRPEQTDK